MYADIPILLLIEIISIGLKMLKLNKSAYLYFWMTNFL